MEKLETIEINVLQPDSLMVCRTGEKEGYCFSLAEIGDALYAYFWKDKEPNVSVRARIQKDRLVDLGLKDDSAVMEFIKKLRLEHPHPSMISLFLPAENDHEPSLQKEKLETH